MMEWHGLRNMNSRLLLFYAALMLVVGYGSKACFQEERAALLNYKEFLKPYKKSVETSLSSWANDPKSDCCEWERVTCDPASGRVIRLSLHFLYGASKPAGLRLLPDSNSACLNFLRLNFSLFLPFKDLRSLDLSSNCFNDSVLTRDYGGKTALQMLETLDLSNCAFNSSVLEMLRSFKSLKTLLLSNNKLDGAFPVQELLPLQNLERLDLSSNMLLVSRWTMHDSKRLSTLKKLETLDLSYTYLEMNTAGIFKNLSAFKSLKILALRGNGIAGPLAIHDLSLLQNLETLDLSDNELTSPSTTPGMCRTQNLQELYLNGNNLSGNLAFFSCLGNLTSLRALDLSDNNLSGNISSSFGAQHTLLELLSLSDNNFEGTFPLSSLTNYSKLKVLRLGGVQNKNFQVETENPPWVPSFQLEYLDMANCQVNLATRTIPTFLSYQRGLRYIDLSNSNLVGSFPNWLLVNNPKLDDAFLNNNYFNGSFLLPSGEGQHTDHLYTLDISHNKIHDKLPETLGFFYPNLRYLNASNNVLDGDIPASIGEMSFLKTLDLAYNNFSGKLPSDMFRGCTSLQILRLSHNGFRGQILPAPLSIIYLKMLMVDNNHFNGTLQDGLRSLQDLRVLDISNNKLSGELPGWVGNLKLRFLSASWNNFAGAIPIELCELEQLVFVSLSHNRFSGAIPSCLGMPSSLMFIHLQKNSLIGTIPESLLSSKLSSLDLGDNNITGGIPKSVNRLANLMFLSLAGNRLQGQLPRQICELKGLYILDLSRNNFTGPIPTCLNNISFGNEGFPAYSNLLYCYFEFLYLDLTYTVYRYLHFYVKMYDKGAAYWIPEEMQLATKGSSLSYKGNILDHMTGLDLSFNRLEGKVPQQLGDLIALRALNLSHNNLEGSIPRSFQKLNNIESLDLSFNKLSGPIPPQLQSLNSLSVFNVSYNNLSGKAPDKGQFATFDESSYRGNPYLSWNISNQGIATPLPPPAAALIGGDNNSAIDFTSFFWTFGASYVMAILMFVGILWINPYWRRVWFYFIEDCLYKCFGGILKDTFY